MIKPRFIHLHVHSDYSMFDGLSTVNKLIAKAASLKMPALALTDFNNLFGFIKFYDSAYKSGIKPIIGADFLLQDVNIGNKPSKLTCLATDKQGYYHLIMLISKAYKNKHNNIALTIQRHWLIEYNKGLILLSGGCNGEIGRHLLRNEKSKIEQCLYFYSKYFPNRYYLELIRTGRQNEEFYLQLAIELSMVKGLPVVATNDVRFINEEDFLAHEIRVAIYAGTQLNNIQQLRKYSSQQFMKSEEEMCKLFSDIPESLVNSVEIAYKCNITIDLGKSFLPQFPTGCRSAQDFLTTYAEKGLEERLILLFPKTKERLIKRIPYDLRLQHELQVINSMNFPSYFLIVMEFIKWAKNNDIPVGPGRGSGTSSLVAYVLKITELDPLQFDLLFERFLNPERISMPDLDIDFCMDHRDLVIEHVSKTYGSDAVSQIITFGTMAAKAVIRDVGRALGHPYTLINHIAKLIPSEPGITLEKAISIEPQLKLLYENDEDITTLIDMARQLEGIVRNVSKHAGGVVIAPIKITDFSPLYYDNDSIHPMTQFDKDDIERIGLIKFDFLGLRTLTIIKHTLKMINNTRLKHDLAIIDIHSLSLHDQKSFRTLQSSKTTAIFQLESRGIKELIKRLKPDCFEDLIALIALFRPGPLQSGMVDNFINRKHGYETISYPDAKWQHESLRPVLESTYGIILYQEQVMQIAQVLAGYTLGQADILRRAIGKKKPEDMAKQRSFFNLGATKNGIDTTLSMKIFDLLEKFAGYGFNKSHSAAYALISYQTLWLKTHYPSEFMAAALSSDMDNLNKVSHLIGECQKMNLKILPPNINTSQHHFYVNEHKEIVYGFGAIKGIGKTSIESIITSRNKDGNFKELFDLCIRIDSTKINHRMIEKLILSGACDSFGIHRLKLVASLNDVLKRANQHIKNKYSKQTDIFDMRLDISNTVTTADCNYNASQWSSQLLLEKEKEALGLYLTSHPTVQYMKTIKSYMPNIVIIKDVILETNNNKMIHIFGVIVSIRTKLSKRGKRVVFFILEDYSGRLEIMIFEKLIHSYQYCLKENNLLIVTGVISIDKIHGYYKIIAQKLEDINDIYTKHARSLSITLNNKEVNNQLLTNIHFFLEKNRLGTLPVYFFYQKNDIQIKLHCGKKWYVTLTDQLLTNLRSLVGDKQIKLELH
ncbi:DNA polymerase III subunit alpha [Blochmannia endosymbiont of Camponotus sp. C-003]|uniref:DNA polymerase III subunit alpha n=1 Tax=unclassified Candidatus Blochmanniella TaxID=711328 RepID=UPI0020242645|nr:MULTISPECIES: DNA polymerase III subunit alpha [unclassified Candidatus Blochmannia]URJ23523.1 DNA polymerase III subunit alpha [Blochmannia endosymbiont of Camponotus sp. C-003]URJ28995.1 DNA polymerase III subunit alpha [Blochmannia endosymbiont of Camponotus sp. C-046]